MAAQWRRAGEDTGHHRSPGPRFLAKPHWTPPVPHDAFDKAGTTQHLPPDAYVYSNEFPAIRGHIRPTSTCKIARPVVQKKGMKVQTTRAMLLETGLRMLSV